MLQTRSSGNIIQWRKYSFVTILVYNNKNKPLLRYKLGSVYLFKNIFMYVFLCQYYIMHTNLEMHGARAGVCLNRCNLNSF